MTIIYVLECANKKYYVGRTDSNTIEKRLDAHLKGTVQWTKIYPPIAVVENIVGDEFDEDKYVKMYMKMFGIDNVRGGSYSQIKIPSNKMKVLQSELKTASAVCYICGEMGHYKNRCASKYSKKSITCYRCETKGHYANKCKVRM